MNRHDYGRWQAWHARLGYALLAVFLGVAVYFLFAQQWVSASLTVLPLAFVLWTLHRGS